MVLRAGSQDHSSCPVFHSPWSGQSHFACNHFSLVYLGRSSLEPLHLGCSVRIIVSGLLFLGLHGSPSIMVELLLASVLV